MDALEIGLSRAEFGAMTIRQLFQVFAASARRQRQERNRDVTLAWWVTAIELQSHTKDGKKRKMPDLHKFLIDSDPKPQKQSPTQMASMLHALAAQHGGTLRKGGTVILQQPQAGARRG